MADNAGLPLDRILRKDWAAVRESFITLARALNEERTQRLTREYSVNAVPFNAADFAGENALTWTVAAGDVLGFHAARILDSLIVSFRLDTTTTGGVTDPVLTLAIPFGFTCNRQTESVGFVSTTGGGVESLRIIVTPAVSTRKMRLLRQSGANWPLETNTVVVIGQIAIPID